MAAGRWKTKGWNQQWLLSIHFQLIKTIFTDQILEQKSTPKNMFSQTNMPSAKTVVSTAASIAASAMVIRSIARDLIPYDLQHYLSSTVRSFLRSFSSDIILIIEEFDGLVSNQIYKAADIYLGNKVSSNTKMFKVSMPEKETKLRTSMTENQEVVDKFNGAKFKWRQITRQVEPKRVVNFSNPNTSNVHTEARYFHLSFHKKHKDMVFESYFPSILKESKRLKDEKKTLKIFTLSSDHMRRYSSPDHIWNSINLDHPATFDTLAMDGDLKKMIVDDLDMFVKRRDFYRNVGRAWKRGYLLYGPPGTGKSSLIAAMANYLNFDIYDLELTDIHANSALRRLLIATANRSILVVEDIDCSLELEDRSSADARVPNALRSANLNQAATVNIVHKPKVNGVTLSGLLNFIDGLWSSCGDERIIVFTTNHKDRLDEALLRPGRMDVHIHMSYCTPCGFKTLAKNYLQITEHALFPEIDHLLGKAKITPAEVGEQLIKNSDPDLALAGLIEFIEKKKKRESEGMEVRGVEEHEKGKIGTENQVEQTV